MADFTHQAHAFAGSILDRRVQMREGAKQKLAVRLAGDRALVAAAGANSRLALFEAVDGLEVHLGIAAGGNAIIAQETEAGEPPEGHAFVDLRTLAMQGLLPAHDLALLAQARSLLAWHARHRFCANCGQATEVAEHGYRRDCRACRAQHFPRTDPVVIVAATRRKRCLLGRGHNFLPGVYSALAGFVEPGEAIEEAAQREVLEETGIAIGSVRYHSSQPWPFPSSLMIGLIARGLNDDIRLDAAELADARWFDRDELAQMFEDRHPQGLKLPKPAAIAHHLVKAALNELQE